MKKLPLIVLICLIVFSAAAAKADTLQLISTGGGSSGGEDIYPYNFSINGSSTLTSLMCISLDRSISFNEIWQVNVVPIPLDNSTLSVDERADAYIYSQIFHGTSDSDAQWAAWSILDPSGTSGNSAFTTAASTLASNALLAANNPTLFPPSFYSQFQLYVPTSDQTGWTYGIPQIFIGDASPTPEPSSLYLLGTGLIGFAVIMRRKLVQA